ncbi:MAG: PKD domain-containing protein [Clostridia bacterium]
MPKRQKPKKKLGCLVAILVLIIGAGTLTWVLLNNSDNNMTVGKKATVVSASIPVAGGEILISDSSSPIDGLKIGIPENAYEQKKDFTISVSEIKSHSFGSNFNPVTPLITIDNGGAFSSEPMKVTIPVSTDPDKFAMGFYYDKKTGRLEGIPFTEITSDSITLMTCHFSDILVAETNREQLKNIQINTGFTPGYDDWQFVNRGSWIAPHGHCAGQAITMMWYYTEKHQGDGERRLYGRFDNNTYGYGTIDFWQDDSLGYRFCSVTQNVLDWNSRSRKFFNEYVNTGDINSYSAFAFSMMMTGEPQYMSIRGDYTDSAGNVQNVGHALVAYKIDAGVIYISDPNYPGTVARTVHFDDNGSFRTYNSGINANEIAKSGEIGFDQIYYYGKTGMIDYSSVAALYEKVLDRTIGNDTNQFPVYSIERLVKIDPVTGNKTWEPFKDQYDVDMEETASVDPSLAGKIVFRIKNFGNLLTSCYKDISPVKEVSVKNLHGFTGSKEYTLELEKGINHIGFLIEMDSQSLGNAFYSDFQRIKVNYDQKILMEFMEQPYQLIQGIETGFKAKVEGAPRDVIYMWDFGDGTEILETDKPVAAHIYELEGPYQITLRCISKKDGFSLAETTAQTHVTSLYGTWDLSYKIESSKTIDLIINIVLRVIGEQISDIFGIETETTARVSIKGTEIGCVMTVIPPEQEGGTIRVQLQQLTSSTDFLEPVDDLWEGVLVINKDNIKIIVDAEKQPFGFRFNGVADGSGISGTFSATVMSGSFNASHP